MLDRRRSTALLLAFTLIGAGFSCTGDTDEPAGTAQLQGRLTFDFVNWIRHETEAIVDISLPGVEFRRSASGRFGWRHPNGDLIRTLGCGSYVNRLVVERAGGGSEILSPCSSEIRTASAGKPLFGFARLSPDGKRIAAELKYYVSPGWRYSVVVLESGEIVASFDGFVSPAWLPDGRLIFAGDGLYVSPVDGTPARIDDGWLGVGVVNPDVSPDGRTVVFEYNERLWTMNIDGKERRELVAGPMQYRFPAWSPDGQRIAFIAIAGSAHSEVERAIHILDVKSGEFERVDTREFGGPLSHVPFGPLSWTP